MLHQINGMLSNLRNYTNVIVFSLFGYSLQIKHRNIERKEINKTSIKYVFSEYNSNKTGNILISIM